MRQTEDRIKLMHLRAAQIKRKRDSIQTAVLGTVSLVLMVCLVTFMLLIGGSQHEIDGGMLTGSSMLDASIGGYVLVGVLSFAVAVSITLLCVKWRAKNRKDYMREYIDKVGDEE